jgi:tricarballylate dehydrogenase
MPKTVLVIGGGNAALCSAIESAEHGHSVTMLESSSESLRGGNSKYTRDIRYVHQEDRYTSGTYLKDELLHDLVAVSGQFENPDITELVVNRSENITDWMADKGIIFKKEIRGTLNLSRTNAFFMGGGKVLIDTYYESLKKFNVKIAYDTEVIGVSTNNDVISSVTTNNKGQVKNISADKYIFASGGFEADKLWLKELWGDQAKNIKVRGSKYNTGKPLKALLSAGAQVCGEERSGHMVAVDDRSPEFDAGIVSRIDAIPWGIVVNKHGSRFYDEGEDIWPKRYAIWGRLVAEQEDQIAYVIVDRKAQGRYMPTAYPPIIANSIEELSSKLNLDSNKVIQQISMFNDGVKKEGDDYFQWSNPIVKPIKSHWALPITDPPFIAYPLRPGLTFTYQGIKISKTGRIVTKSGEIENAFAAGEIASGNVLRSGYLAGFGLTIGTVLGRLAGGWEND